MKKTILIISVLAFLASIATSFAMSHKGGSFAKFDKDKSGYIEKSEWDSVFKSDYHHKLSDADKDSDGKISKKEWQEYKGRAKKAHKRSKSTY